MVMPSGPLHVVPDIDDQLDEQNNKPPASLLTPGTPLLSAVSPLSAGKIVLINSCIMLKYKVDTSQSGISFEEDFNNLVSGIQNKASK